MFNFKTLCRVSLFLFSLFCASVWAHVDGIAPQEHDTFFSGVLHPLTGLDHVSAMVAVGIWSALALHRAWLAPTVFIIAMGVGMVLGTVGFGHVAIEPTIAVSVLVMGMLIAARDTLSLRAALVLVAAFGFCHGAAHGIVLHGISPFVPAAGMLLSTMVLHLLGVVLGQRAFAPQVWLQRLSGGAFAALGLALLSGLS
ncbi:MAG: urease accessory protein UreJ [Betaproteobacteria bacterium]|nr:HupE/UreJ family protein [Burkholderiales bacterium]NBO13311.1 urease accessory protein UreJ [Betaproteobacteria bacterium]NBO45327.1 urease accessory protein UreJ [Betaproteobacteria bacterium]NBO95856.1 urease accessory protein UreJ [Betaproteobacteria bacterium]NBQ82542.1 urease accessory protein UreJ [Betaproteobacteria bacterium]